jgi:hypothetical protein
MLAAIADAMGGDLQKYGIGGISKKISAHPHLSRLLITFTSPFNL